MNIQDDFLSLTDREYGPGYFCTPDVMERINLHEQLLSRWLSYLTQAGEHPMLLDLNNPVHKLIHDTRSALKSTGSRDGN
jgi:hypothetical protein